MIKFIIKKEVIIINTLKNILITLFLCIVEIGLTIASTKGGKGTDKTKDDKKHNTIYIAVNVHNCNTNTTDSTYELNVPKNRNIGILKQVLESIPSTKIQIEQFIFSQRYVSESDTFEDLSVTDGSTVIALGDTAKIPNMELQIEQECTKAEADRLLDIRLRKTELNPNMFRKYIYLNKMYLSEDTPEIQSHSLNINYEKLPEPSEEPLPVTWQF